MHRLFSFGLALFPVVTHALEIPQVKPGLWEIRMQSAADGAPLTPTGTTKICWDAATLARSAKTVEESSKKDCSKYEVRKEGGKWIQNGVCKLRGGTVSGLMTREFSGENAYHDDSNSTYDPPFAGHSRKHLIIDGKWLGPC